jgi:hypothetical protein
MAASGRLTATRCSSPFHDGAASAKNTASTPAEAALDAASGTRSARNLRSPRNRRASRSGAMTSAT